MNLFKKIFCRTYQLAFHAALPLLPYREPQVLSGIGEIPPLLQSLGRGSVLLVTDEYLRASGATAPLERSLAEAGIRCAVYDKTRANPTVDNVEEAAALYRAEGCRALIAFGGGSPIDCAKGVGARIAYPHKPFRRLRGNLRVLRKLPPLIAIPTTAGTGSEVTLTAVITDTKNKFKYTMNSFPLIPSHAVLDPEMTFTLPPSLTATTGMDALTHAIEAYIGRSTSRETRRCALEATKLIFANLEKAYADGQDRAARENMLRAAYLAGIAFSKSYVGYVHAVAHSLGGQYNIPHGLANSVLLPYVLEAYGERAHRRLHDLAVAAGVATAHDDPAFAAVRLIAAIREMNRRMGIPSRLAGIRPEDIPAMARHADREANPLYPVPMLMDARALEQFYQQVTEEV